MDHRTRVSHTANVRFVRLKVNINNIVNTVRAKKKHTKTHHAHTAQSIIYGSASTYLKCTRGIGWYWIPAASI